MFSGYYDKTAIKRAVRRGGHRQIVGGLWDQVGQLQRDFIVAAGLSADDRLLDVGCGSLRAGVKLVEYLNDGNYYGTDINRPLIDAGYAEIANSGLEAKLPRSNLIEDGEFDFTWARDLSFRFVLAQSLFTHLPLKHLRLCLERLPPIVPPGGRLFATIFEVPEDHPNGAEFKHSPGGVISKSASDPYHYRFSDVRLCCQGLPWTATYIGEWGHPRDQKMIRFDRVK
jgi:SAM-dependent methyltransferase